MKVLARYFPAKKAEIDASIKPEGWIVLEMGQSLLHCLWFCVLLEMETKESVFSEEHDTAQEAFEAAVKLALGGGE